MGKQPTYNLRNANIGRDFIGRDRIENIVEQYNSYPSDSQAKAEISREISYVKTKIDRLEAELENLDEEVVTISNQSLGIWSEIVQKLLFYKQNQNPINLQNINSVPTSSKGIENHWLMLELTMELVMEGDSEAVKKIKLLVDTYKRKSDELKNLNIHLSTLQSMLEKLNNKELISDIESTVNNLGSMFTYLKGIL
ncbi:MAG: hypothetical protein QNJ63_29890 [Calothrix sp. MO_192.B10]|nr:hypothetical protein [Calothrix sp. MO_192.B10]